MDTALLPAFFAVSLIVIITPGADWAYILSHARSTREAMASIGGLLIGYAGHTILATAGLTVALALLPGALTTLTFVGAAYLCWLGVQSLRHPDGFVLPAPVQAQAISTTTGTIPVVTRSITLPALVAQPQHPLGRVVAKGAGVSGLNPKVVLLYLSILPQFISPDAAWSLSAQTAMLGGVHVLATMCFYTLLALAAVRVLDRHPGVFKPISIVSGILMLCFGVALIADQVVTLLR
ncbi:LysE family translocator [Pseudoclavibacter sp. 13-3]|uniref:LysE family translocator n=1 Tax=Pseudoclavibacter sp. 13-3 TaxID=2901228 RepID=UPI001E4179C2|nr:LysE family translocator [Pseudoclavibacter sp. 13-3]MCD7100959.1 LysE family translocator [Pseudoclavibacter sp. 13-3]